jgi:hypothetical protein
MMQKRGVSTVGRLYEILHQNDVVPFDTATFIIFSEAEAV